jgi:hypothetical protein
MMTEVNLTAKPSMIAVRMRDEGLIHGLPWIDIKFASGAIKTFGCEFD